MRRIIGEVHSGSDEILLICLGGIHGNEREGVRALQTIFEHLAQHPTALHGSLVGIVGNAEALRRGERFIDQDLNRAWVSDWVLKPEIHEHQELEQIIKAVDAAENGQNFKRKILLDLHATSAERGIFLVADHCASQYCIWDALPLPTLIGVNEILAGTTISYFSSRQYEAMAFEGGQIGQKTTAANHLQVVWWVMEAAGLVAPNDVPREVRQYDGLKQAVGHLPGKYRFAYKHSIEPGEQFRMLEGFRNFDRVYKGQPLAINRFGNIYARCNGYMLMPLYQPTGSDGFFIIEAIGDRKPVGHSF